VNPRLDLLHQYPFERLRLLHQDLAPAAGLPPINLGIGEPQHATPDAIRDAICSNLDALGKYPPTGGTPELRQAISDWISTRYAVPPLDPDRMVLPVAGTREALFAIAQVLLDPSDPGAVLMPNPFYQIYEGAALLAGARPVYVPTPAEGGYLPDWDAVGTRDWQDAKIAYVCSPGNPTGSVMRLEDWTRVFEWADRLGVIVLADECYSEIYNGDPPTGALEAASRLGRGYDRLLSFNSLSKRSSAPGLRSGFVAGDPDLVRRFLHFRAYHGAAPSLLTQLASVPAWSDEAHVEQNREKYRAKYRLAERILPGCRIPDGSFFLWLQVEDDVEFSRRAYREAALTVLPGTYLGREASGVHPGAGHIRVALVAEIDVCEEALHRLAKLF
jgi:N-succinyldiaminopimelate aminotransferase